MKDKKSKIQLIIIIVELIILVSLSGYRLYEYVNEESVEAVKYTVIFDYGNGTNRSIEVKENEKIELPSEPIKEGYIFGGWYYDGMLFDKNSIITDNIILKANWIERLDLPTIKILVYQINIRKEANENSEDIGDVLLDETYEVLEIIDSTNYTWYKIKQRNIIGYVANQKGENWIEYSDNKIEELDINSDLVKSLIFPLQDKELNCDFNPFKTEIKQILKNNIEISNIDNETLLEIFLYYYFSDWNRNKKIPVETIDGIYYSILKKEVLNSYYEKIYGPDIDFMPQTVKGKPFASMDDNMTYSIQNEYYYWRTHYGVGTICVPATSNYLRVLAKKAEKINDEIIVYYNIYETLNGGSPHAEIENSSVKILVKDYRTDTEVASKKCDLIENDAHRFPLCSQEEENKFIEELSMQNKLPIYKATFKKQSDGNYYFAKGEWQ